MGGVGRGSELKKCHTGCVAGYLFVVQHYSDPPHLYMVRLIAR